MPIARRQTAAVESDNKPVYSTSFVHRVHRVLKMGYDRLDAKTFATAEEEDITGELTRTMQEAVHSCNAPRWAKHFWAAEEVRVTDTQRLGKRRRRIDIAVIQHQAGPRPRFRFEAKRLRDAATRREYFGHDGLGCFLDGRYAKDDCVAGMLGYVQAGTVDQHAAGLRDILRREPSEYAVATAGEWTKAPFPADLPTYHSVHRRPTPLSSITILHTLLPFS